MVNAHDDDTVESKPRAQAAGKNPRAIAKVVTRIIPGSLLKEEEAPQEEKSSIPVPAGVSPTDKKRVSAASSAIPGSLTLGKLVEYEKMGISVEPVGIADAMDRVDESRQDTKFSAEERNALLEDEDMLDSQMTSRVAEGSSKKARSKGEGAGKGFVSNAEEWKKTETQEPPNSLLNIPKPAYQPDLLFAQELSMVDPKVVSSLVKEWVKG